MSTFFEHMKNMSFLRPITKYCQIHSKQRNKDINSELLIIAEYLTVYLCKRRLLSENHVQYSKINLDD